MLFRSIELLNSRLKRFNDIQELHKVQSEYIAERERQTGRTIRLVDYYIQELFKNPNSWITIKDHYDHPTAHKVILGKILKRLDSEHNISEKQTSRIGIEVIKEMNPPLIKILL